MTRRDKQHALLDHNSTKLTIFKRYLTSRNLFILKFCTYAKGVQVQCITCMKIQEFLLHQKSQKITLQLHAMLQQILYLTFKLHGQCCKEFNQVLYYTYLYLIICIKKVEKISYSRYIRLQNQIRQVHSTSIVHFFHQSLAKNNFFYNLHAAALLLQLRQCS